MVIGDVFNVLFYSVWIMSIYFYLFCVVFMCEIDWNKNMYDIYESKFLVLLG